MSRTASGVSGCGSFAAAVSAGLSVEAANAPAVAPPKASNPTTMMLDQRSHHSFPS